MLAADVAHSLDLLPDIVLADRFHDFIERVEQILRLQGRAGDRLAVRQFRGRSSGERCHDLAFQIGPGQPLGFNLDAWILRLETARKVVEGFDGLRLSFRVPNANELVLRESRRGDADGQCGRERDHPRHMHGFPPVNTLINFKPGRATRPPASRIRTRHGLACGDR